jgi:Outer membrane protein beta-barrel domain
MMRMRGLCPLALLLGFCTTAAAQGPEPIGRFAADVRVALPGYPQTATVATALGVDPLDLPTRGLGLAFGAHLYPARKGVVSLGLGAEWMVSQRNRTRDPTTEGGTPGPTVQTRFSSFSPQISLNFGSKQGWSYLSGGLGWGRFTTELQTSPQPDAEGRLRTINYGGGARWFLNQHVAVSLDLRFYAVNPQEATLTRPAYPRMTMVAFNAGLGFK